MDKLKNIIENTLCVNLEINDETEAIDFESVQTCSDYISKEIQEIAVKFAKHLNKNASRQGFNEWILYSAGDPQLYKSEELFNQFINERYKEQP